MFKIIRYGNQGRFYISQPYYSKKPSGYSTPEILIPSLLKKSEKDYRAAIRVILTELLDMEIFRLKIIKRMTE